MVGIGISARVAGDLSYRMDARARPSGLWQRAGPKPRADCRPTRQQAWVALRQAGPELVVCGRFRLAVVGAVPLRRGWLSLFGGILGG